MSLTNREKLCANREKIGTQIHHIFSPLVFHRLRPHDNCFGNSFQECNRSLWDCTCTPEIALTLLNYLQINFQNTTLTLTLTLLFVFELQM